MAKQTKHCQDVIQKNKMKNGCKAIRSITMKGASKPQRALTARRQVIFMKRKADTKVTLDRIKIRKGPYQRQQGIPTGQDLYL